MNPLEQSRRDAQQAVSAASLGYGYLDSVFPDENRVKIQPAGQNKTIEVDIGVLSAGDRQLPSTDDPQLPVIYASVGDDIPIVIGYTYDTDAHDIPSAEPGERRVGHQYTDSHIYFQQDGTLLIKNDAGATIEMQPDGTIVLNNGTDGVITDVSTETDGDGHVTDVSVTREDTIQV